MNPAALTMMPMVSNNPTQQTSTTSSNSTTKFGDILESKLSNNGEVTQVNTTKTELTTEQKKELEDLLTFLGVDSLSELEDGNVLVEKLLMGDKLS